MTKHPELLLSRFGIRRDNPYRYVLVDGHWQMVGNFPLHSETQSTWEGAVRLS